MKYKFPLLPLLILFGCSPKDNSTSSQVESMEEYTARSKKEDSIRKINSIVPPILFDEDARPFDESAAKYFSPRKFDYTILLDKSKMPNKAYEFYPIGFSADWNYFAFIKQSSDHNKKLIYSLQILGSKSKYIGSNNSLDSTRTLTSLNEIWSFDKNKIEKVLKKYKIIQENPLNFKFQAGSSFSSPIGDLKLGLKYKITQLVTRRQGSTTTSSPETLAIELYASYPNGYEKLVTMYNRAYEPIRNFQIPGALRTEKMFFIISAFTNYLDDDDNRYIHFDILPAELD